MTMTDTKYWEPGSLEVICGSMFSGKSEELIRRLRVAEYAKKKVVAFKPANDTRYDASQIASHLGTKYPVITGYENDPEKLEYELQNKLINADVIGIEEAQFWDKSIVDVCDRLSAHGYRVIVAGLDLDYLGKPFGPMPNLMAIATKVTKLHAVCTLCGETADRTYRTSTGTDLVDVGATDKYEARCRYHFYWSPGNMADHMGASWKSYLSPKKEKRARSIFDSGFLSCDFCGKDKYEVGELIRGPETSICGHCIKLAQMLLTKP